MLAGREKQQPTSVNDLSAELRLEIYKHALPEMFEKPQDPTSELLSNERFFGPNTKARGLRNRPVRAGYRAQDKRAPPKDSTLGNLRLACRLTNREIVDLEKTMVYYFYDVAHLYDQWQRMRNAGRLFEHASFYVKLRNYPYEDDSHSPDPEIEFLCLVSAQPGWLYNISQPEYHDLLTSCPSCYLNLDGTTPPFSGLKQETCTTKDSEQPWTYQQFFMPNLATSLRFKAFRWQESSHSAEQEVTIHGAMVLQGKFCDLEWPLKLDAKWRSDRDVPQDYDTDSPNEAVYPRIESEEDYQRYVENDYFENVTIPAAEEQ